MKRRILVVDDEPMVIDVVTALLDDMGFHVSGLTDPQFAVEEAVDGHYDLIIVDLKMPGISGAEVVAQILSRRPDARVVVNTAFPDDPTAQEAIDQGALGVLRKPNEVRRITEFLNG